MYCGLDRIIAYIERGIFPMSPLGGSITQFFRKYKLVRMLDWFLSIKSDLEVLYYLSS